MKRNALISVAVISLVLLVGAAYVGGQLLNGQALALPNGQAINSSAGSVSSKGCDVTRKPAAELPPEPPLTRRGVLVRRENNSIFMGVAPDMTTIQNRDGTISTTVSYDGPIVEIVVTHDTQIFRDVTFEQNSGSMQCGQVQEVLEPGTLNDIVEDTTFLVWGARNGDRIVASHLVYELPPVLKKP